MHAHSPSTPHRRPLHHTALLLALSLAVACGPAREEPGSTEARSLPTATDWWSEPEQVALEPRAITDAAGRVWATWIETGSEEPRLVIACEVAAGQRVRATIELAGDWLAAPDLAPLEGGVLCIWEEGLDSGEARGLTARSARLESGAIALGPPERLLDSAALTPRLCATGPDRVELIAVSAADPQADLSLVHAVRAGGAWSAPTAVLASPGDAWSPALAADARGRLHVAWDYFDGDAFRVDYAILESGVERERHELRSGAGYQAHAALAVTDSGAAWIAWEQAAQFGQIGGLRGERELGLAKVEDGTVLWAARESLPDALYRSDFPHLLWSPDGLLITTRGLGPSFAAPSRRRAAQAGEDPARERTNLREPEPRTRVYLDQRARFYSSWWTRLVRFDEDGAPVLLEIPQTEGDNLATESLVATADGPLLLCAADLRSTQQPRPDPFEAPIESRWRVGALELPAALGFPKLASEPPVTEALALPATPARALRAELAARGDERGVYFGDLHRHTHLSRCAGAKDGVTTDVYRYARGPGGLDFVAITDHFQHLQPWSFWRNQRDVVRFHAPGRLVVFAGLERASKDRGHRNDIYLDGTTVRYDPAAWNDFPETGEPTTQTTLSIPHMMGRSESPWRWSWTEDERHRVFEIYQGARGSYEGANLPLVATDFDVPEAGVGVGLARGHQFGFIGSSDHGLTAAGLAGVEAEELTRASIFAALHARHSFAATDFARVETRLGALHSGDVGPAADSDGLTVRARGQAPVAAIEVFKNGEPLRRLGGEPGEPERIVLTLRRYGPYPDKPMLLRLVDAELGSWSVRRRGALDSAIERTATDTLSITKGIQPLDLVFELTTDMTSDPTRVPALELSVGAERTRVALADLPLDRTLSLGSVARGNGFARDQLWRIGPSLHSDQLTYAFDDLELRAGDSFYARVVFEDGNVVWSSPIRVDAIVAEEAEAR